MGNRSYLSIRTKNEEEALFEANNSLPVFWIGLLDEEIIKNHENDWKAYDLASHSDDDIPSQPNDITNPSNDENDRGNETIDFSSFSLNLIVNRAKLNVNAERMRQFLGRHIPEAVALFTDFKDFLGGKLQDDEAHLELDIIEFANFTSVDDLLGYLYRQVQAIKNDQPEQIGDFKYDLIGLGSGFTYFNVPFDTPAYQKALTDRGKVHHIPTAPLKFKKKELMVYVVMLLICPLFSYYAFHLLSTEGFSLTTIVIIFCNLLFYVASIYGIISELKARARERG